MLIESKFDLSHPRSMDTSKREKPPEVKNLLKIGSPEEDSKLVPNNYQDLFFKLMILIRHKCELKQQAHFDKFKNPSSAPPCLTGCMSSIFRTLAHLKCISLTTVKMVLRVLVKYNIVHENYMYRPLDELAEAFREFRPSWLNNSACNNAEKPYYEKLSKCKVASSMTESSDPPTTANDTMIHQLIDLTIK